MGFISFNFKVRHAFVVCYLLAATLVSIVESSPDKDEILSYKGLERPFRMNKVNLLWEKARLKLTEGKLQSLYSELKMQDKQELTLKRVRAEQGDKEGAMEAEVRKAFTGIMNTYGLAGASSEDSENPSRSGQKLQQVMFKDKKLNRLWEKAEKAGLTEEERLSLKQEFMHHQEKMDEYHKLLDVDDVMGRDGNIQSNHLHPSDDEEFHKRDDNALDGLAKEVKADYDRLHRIATNANPKEFEDEVARSLWKLAKEADFTPEELDSLRDELHHFQARRAKMHYLEAELSMVDKRHGGEFANEEEEGKTHGRKIMDKKLKKHVELVEKAERDFERRIAARHSEL